MLKYLHRSRFPDERMLHGEATRTIGECPPSRAWRNERRNVGTVNVIIRLAREEWGWPRHVIRVPRCRQAALRHQPSAHTHKTSATGMRADTCIDSRTCRFTYMRCSHMCLLHIRGGHITMKTKRC